MIKGNEVDEWQPNIVMWNRYTPNITFQSPDTPIRKPKLSVIELLMYNIAALLAGVAAGFDIRLQNNVPPMSLVIGDDSSSKRGSSSQRYYL